MLGRLVLFFLITPVIELALLIQIGEHIGFWPTVAIIVATGLAGSFLARREGFSVWQRFNQRLADGGLPGHELVDGMIILVAGALLITPGVLTDVFGFIGLLPFTRAPVRRFLIKRLKRRVEDGSVHLHVGGFGVASAANESSTTASPSSSSNGQREDDAAWEGTGRQVPRHSEELGQSGARGEEGDAVENQ